MKIRPGVAVIGMGNLGNSLAFALEAAGLHPMRLHARLPKRVTAKADIPDRRILWLTVPDNAIGAVALRLARQGGLEGRIVVHSSGALDAGILKAAEAAGARTASVHPMMSFPTWRVVPLAGVRFAVETRDATVERELFRLVRKLGGRPFRINGENKALYHAGAMFGSPLLAALLAAGIGVLGEAGIPEREALALLGPMAAATVENIRKRGPDHSFSGPIARGDAATIKLHRKALVQHPLEAAVYAALARYAVRHLPSADRDALSRALSTRRRSQTKI